MAEQRKDNNFHGWFFVPILLTLEWLYFLANCRICAGKKQFPQERSSFRWWQKLGIDCAFANCHCKQELPIAIDCQEYHHCRQELPIAIDSQEYHHCRQELPIAIDGQEYHHCRQELPIAIDCQEYHHCRQELPIGIDSQECYLSKGMQFSVMLHCVKCTRAICLRSCGSVLNLQQ